MAIPVDRTGPARHGGIGLALVASGHSDAGVAVVGFGAALILIATAAHLISRPQSE